MVIPRIFQIATGYWASQVVYVAAKLGIADLLAEGPKTCDELAAAIDADDNAMGRLLRALASMGVLARERDLFYLNQIGLPLRRDVPGSLRSMLLTLGEEHYRAWGRLLHSVRSSEPAFDRAYGAPLFQYLQSNRAAGETFSDAMNDFTRQAALACVLAYDFSGIQRAVDVGGGRGALISTILRGYPMMTGILFDFADVIQGARQDFKDGIEDRCEMIPGDFFESVPEGADAYLLKNVLHDWDDASTLKILRNCRRAMSDRAKLLVIEMVLQEQASEPFGSLLDLNMLVMSGGRERTEAEYRNLFEQAGFRLKGITATMAPVSVIEGAPA
jgi:O-methyltransferase domain/Dimerisation domain